MSGAELANLGKQLMNGNCVAIIAANRKAIIRALQSQGFSLVADLPVPIRLDPTARGMIRARAVQ